VKPWPSAAASAVIRIVPDGCNPSVEESLRGADRTVEGCAGRANLDGQEADAAGLSGQGAAHGIRTAAQRKRAADQVDKAVQLDDMLAHPPATDGQRTSCMRIALGSECHRTRSARVECRHAREVAGELTGARRARTAR